MKHGQALGASAHQNLEGNVDLRVHVRGDEAAAADIEAHDFVMTYDVAYSLFENLGATLKHLADERMRNMAAGDCATCGNHRVIEVVRINGGRSRAEQVHCPDCHDRYAHAVPAYPTRQVTA